MPKSIQDTLDYIYTLRDRWIEEDRVRKLTLSEEEQLKDHIRELDPDVKGYAPNAPSLAASINLDLDKLPSLSILTPIQVEQMVDTLQQLLAVVGHRFSWPDGFPMPRLYKIILNVLKEPGGPCWYGALHHSGCGGWPADCWWQEYCPCLIYAQEEDEDWSMDDDSSSIDYPF